MLHYLIQLTPAQEKSCRYVEIHAFYCHPFLSYDIHISQLTHEDHTAVNEIYAVAVAHRGTLVANEHAKLIHSSQTLICIPQNSQLVSLSQAMLVSCTGIY